ncbi:MAG: Eco57I restriction-modification methylase domain-containing protein [Succinivibrio sp.]|nr:Eco57I restriction-modification methylase domain-containing protein [Succinivibrio sp.]
MKNEKLEHLKQYLHQSFQGIDSFLKEIIYPIFGEDNVTSYNQNLIADNPELKTLASSSGIKEVKRFAQIELDFYPIDIFEVTVTDKVKMARNRVSIQQVIRRCMDSFSGAFMIFHYDNNWEWRFTFCSKGKDNTEFTDNKRYTFLLGKDQSCRTAAENFLSLIEKREKNIELKEDDLIAAFSVEALSKRFFDDYKKQYTRFVDFLSETKTKTYNDFESLVTVYANQEDRKSQTEKNIRDYVKKLLGRIVFIQFLQKKGWMGVPQDSTWGSGDTAFLKNLFKYSTEAQQENFLDEVLEPVFSNALDSDRRDNNDLFDTNVNFASGSIVKIPYLNGGLFERDSLDELQVRFPKEYFADLFDLFDQYNFTIDENDPNDAVVGVDPEMLGLIFENLLEDNKDKGAFYTPKKIVQFMCKESLIQYLKQSIKDFIEKESKRKNKDIAILNDAKLLLAEDGKVISDFVNTNESSKTIDIRTNAILINHLLSVVKICDPAIGSGAFPLGLLNEIFNCRRALHNIIDSNSVISNASLKKEILQKNIYGVDIEKGAVDIARLRFWLSIIVDEESPNSLPNLDFKIMQGNSLLESFDGVDLSDFEKTNIRAKYLATDLFATDSGLLSELNFIINKYFDTSDHDKKRSYLKDIGEHVKKILLSKLKDSDNQEIYNKIINLKIENPFIFLWHIYFAPVFDDGGFDIVIGNPPYIQLQKATGVKVLDKKGKQIDQKLGDIYAEEKFESFERTGDIYCLFYEKGFSLLKEHGTLCYITSNKWMRAGYGESLRNYFATKTNPLKLLDLSGAKIFDNATVDVNILLSEKAENQGNTQACSLTEKTGVNNLSLYLNQNQSECPFTTKDSWVILSKIEQSIKRKIESVGTPLKDWKDIKIYRGVLTGCNEAFIISTDKRNEILNNCSSEDERTRTDEIIRPILRGRDIKRYGYDWDNKWLIATFPSRHYDIDLYPALKSYLLKFGKEKLEQSGKKYQINGVLVKSRKKTNNQWFETQDSIAYWDLFFQPKICWKAVGRRLAFALVEEGIYLTAPASFISGDSNNEILLAYLCSAVANYYINQYSDSTGAGDLMLNIQSLVKLPIPQQQSQKLIDAIKRENDDLIDQSIFEIYGFSKDEIDFICNYVS